MDNYIYAKNICACASDGAYKDTLYFFTTTNLI